LTINSIKMLNFTQEIETCLKTLRNTNDKEQNFQGRLYAHLLQFEKEGYIVEMETSVNDEHLKSILKSRMKDSSARDFNKDDFRKIEIDLLVYKPDLSELYASELKWVFNRTTGWNVVDHLEDFKDDAIFCHQLIEKAHFTETCSVVVYDFYPEKQVKRYSPKNPATMQEKMDFLGGVYPAQPSGKIQCNEQGDMASFKWIDLEDKKLDRDYRYYIIQFN